MGSTSYLNKSKSAGYRAKSGSSGGSDKEMNGKLRRPKIRRPTKLNDYGLKRIPDYTELAYKEAVSKLRYFLSGNYAPSVRSYGGSASIKNLDESDADLDKKYNLTTPYNALLEYKPRPRLTAKYATLYADSLNNTYTPQHVSAPPPPTTTPAADLSGGTNPDVINFIQKQEEYIEQLERESQYCRDELNNLLGKVKEVISENEHLHEAQKNKLISRMFHSYNAGSETDDLDELGDSTGLDSDNKMTPSKGRKSGKRSSRLEGPNIVFESRIAELEAQLTQSKIDLKKVQDENNENKRKLASGLVDSTCLDGFKRQIDNLQRDKSSLESQISKLKLSLENREGDQNGKYGRGSEAIKHQLREERNNLEIEVRRLKDDLAKERSKVRELAGEGARRVIQERSAAEQRYNSHFDELQHDLAAQYDNVSKLQLDLERQRREENDLKRELSMKNNAIEELKMELKNKTASLQADLAQAHAEKASLDEELASARLAIERHQRQAKHETNRLNSEIQSLRQRLDRADADLVHSRRENLRLSEQIATLEKELNMKNLTPISPEKKKEKELSSMFESMENKHAKTVAELESMIQSQNSLMEKLTGECRLLTDKLDDANRRHKKELATLHRQVENLGRSLQPTHVTTPSAYQAPPPHLSAAVRNVPHTATGTRPDYTGVDTTGHTPVGDRSVPDIRPDRGNRDDQAGPLSRQDSKASVKGNITPINTINDVVNLNQYNEDKDEVKDKLDTEPEYKDEDEAEIPTVENAPEYEPQKFESNYANHEQGYTPDTTEYERQVDNTGYEHSQVADSEYDQNQIPVNAQYDQSQIASNAPYDQSQIAGNAPYDQSQIVGGTAYEQSQIAEDATYEEPPVAGSAVYDQQHYEQVEQPGYAEGQYENYEQYPQQYTDPNAQYEGQYENYATDPNYQPQNYDNTQYNQEYTQEYQEPQPVTEAQNVEHTESKRSNSPNEKRSSQS